MSNRSLLVVVTIFVAFLLLSLAAYLLRGQNDSEPTEAISRQSTVQEQAKTEALHLGDMRSESLSAPSRSTLGDAQHSLMEKDPYLHASSIDEVFAQLLAEGELTEAELAASMLDWIDACQWAVGIEQSTTRPRSLWSLRGQATKTLSEFCGEVANESDFHAYRRAWDEAAEGVHNRFSEKVVAGDVDAALRAAVDAIFNSRSEFEISNALNTIILFGQLESPFPGIESDSTSLLFGGRPTIFASTALLCDNLGGCLGHHPLVARHCLLTELHSGCYQPRDIYHAIEQTLTPIEHELFWSLINQVRRMHRQLQTEGS